MPHHCTCAGVGRRGGLSVWLWLYRRLLPLAVCSVRFAVAVPARVWRVWWAWVLVASVDASPAKTKASRGWSLLALVGVEPNRLLALEG